MARLNSQVKIKLTFGEVDDYVQYIFYVNDLELLAIRNYIKDYPYNKIEFL